MKKISLIKKARELGLCKISKHPITGDRVIVPSDGDCLDLTDEWEELQNYANNRRNIKVSLKINSKSLSTLPKAKELNSSSKKNCIQDDCSYYNKRFHSCDAPKKYREEYKCSPS